MDPIVLWQHKWSQDLFVPTYLFCGGLAAGLFIVAAVADLVSLGVRRFEALARGAALAAVPVLAVAGLTLTVHLGKPERGLGFPLFFTNYNSWMTRGGWVLGSASPLVVAYAALWYFGVWPTLRRVVGVIGLPVLGLLAVYTGLLLSGAGFVPLWSREHLPRLFLTSGLTTGTAAAGLVGVLAWRWLAPGKPAGAVIRTVGIALALLIVLEGYEVRAFLRHLSEGAPDKSAAVTTPSGLFVAPSGSRLAHRYLTGGPDYPARLLRWGDGAEAAEDGPVGAHPTLAPWFWGGFVGLGLLLPLTLTVVEWLTAAIASRAADAVAAIKFLAVLGGGFALRMVVVWGGDLKAPLPFPPSSWPVPGLGG